MSERKRCIVRACVNHTDEGAFVGDLCSPCHEFVANGKGFYSQAYRNALEAPFFKPGTSLLGVGEIVENAKRLMKRMNGVRVDDGLSIFITCMVSLAIGTGSSDEEIFKNVRGAVKRYREAKERLS